MQKFKRGFIFFIIVFQVQFLNAQHRLSDEMYFKEQEFIDDWQRENEDEFPKFRAKELILPGAAIAYGFLALESNTLIKWNENIKESLGGENETSIDDLGLYLPVAVTYSIDLFTKKSKHNFKDRTLILLTATAINNGTTYGLKAITNEQRPNEEKFNSFPSGHTSNAFMGAEFLRQEFMDESPWYGVIGYAMGTATAYMRLYNNKHWFSDVVAGAGIGILSTKVAYWIYPWMNDLFSNEEGEAQFSFYPAFDQNAPQIGFLVNF